MLKLIVNTAFVFVILFSSSCSSSQKENTHNEPAYQKADSLLQLMTLEEKVAQLSAVWLDKPRLYTENGELSFDSLKKYFPHGIGQFARPSESARGFGQLGRDVKDHVAFGNQVQEYFTKHTRLGIPALFHEECLHGLMAREATNFPQPIAMASSWNPDLIRNVYDAAGKEARSRGTHLALTPVVDVARDSRWGRIEETFGEDPHLVGEMGLAAVEGLSGNGEGVKNGTHVMTTLKHFVAHAEPEGGSNTGAVHVGERELRNIFLAPFKHCIKNGNVHAIMPAFHEIDGIPCHASTWLLQDVLRGEWGFEGVVVADYYAISELAGRHGVAKDQMDASIQALKAGVDIELPDTRSYPTLIEAVKSGKINVDYVDNAVRRVLKQKFELGLFSQPKIKADKAIELSKSQKSKELALKVAEESAVLLHNGGDILPLDIKKFEKIAVVGPNVKDTLLGGYSATPKYYSSVWDGISKYVGDKAKLSYAEGVRITKPAVYTKDEIELLSVEDNKQLIEEAVKKAKKADVVVLAVGENELIAREAWGDSHLGDRTTMELTDAQKNLVNRIVTLGKPTVLLLMSGRPLAVGQFLKENTAVLNCWYLGQETGNALANLLFGEVSPSGKLPISIARSAAHLPVYYNHKPTSRRGYLFEDITPLFPFGFGLSYTEFSLGKPKLSSDVLKTTVELSVNVKNTGKYYGSEVVQLYIRDLLSSSTRPVKELKAFKKIDLKAGEEETVKFTINEEMLSFYGADMTYGAEEGDFEIMVGNSSRDSDLQKVKLRFAK